MRVLKLGIAAIALGSLSTVAVAKDNKATFDCSKMKVVKPKPWASWAGEAACTLLKCDAKTRNWVAVGSNAADIVRIRAEMTKAARDNQECLARAAEISLEMGEPLTVALENGATGTVQGSTLAGPRREFELPLANPQLQFADGDLTTVADWRRTKSKRVSIMDAPTGGTQIGTIDKRKTKLFVMGHYGTGRALVELDGGVAGYVDTSELEDIDRVDRPQFVAASASRPIYAKMTCNGIDFEFDDIVDGAETYQVAECYGPLGEPDFIPREELANA